MLLYELLRNIISMYVDIAEAANPPIKAYTVKISCSTYMLKFNQLEITINFNILTIKGHCTKSMPFLSPVHYKNARKLTLKYILLSVSALLLFTLPLNISTHSFRYLFFFFCIFVCVHLLEIFYTIEKVIIF